jgi:hypothetical protein
MPDIAFLGDKTFLYEKLFKEAGADCRFIPPGLLASPFLPQFKMLMIPTGFANSQYSDALKALSSARSRIEEFVKKGGVLVVFGPLVLDHDYPWLPVNLNYFGEYSERQTLESSGAESSCLCKAGDCDGYLATDDIMQPVLKDEKGRTVLAEGRYGEGCIIATSVHEFPSVQFIRLALSRGKLSKL